MAAVIPRPYNPFVSGGFVGGLPGTDPLYGAPLMNQQPMADQRVPFPRPRPNLAMAPQLRGAQPMGPAQTFGAPAQVPSGLASPLAGAPMIGAATGAPRQGIGSRIGDFLGSDAALALSAGILEGGTTGQALGRGFNYALQARQKPATTDDLTEYAFARQQGYEGTFADFQMAMRAAGAQKTVGTPPPGYRVQYDAAGNPIEMVPIPGSPAAQEAEAAEAAKEVGDISGAEQAAGMLETISGIKKAFSESSTPVTGTLSVPFAMYSGSGAGRVRAYVKHLQSGVGLNAIQRLKEASATGATGFGALSERELDILLNDIGALNPDASEPDIFLETVDRIEAKFKRIAKEVSPERQRELGLDIILGGGGGQTPADPYEAEAIRRGWIKQPDGTWGVP